MAPKTKKEAPAPPKAEVKGKALKAKKAVLKGIHSHKKKKKKKIYILMAQDTASTKVAQISSKEHPQEKQA
ncbi:60s ribosomal protein l23a-like [Lynx pardinus]|uniref:60s ribosomal protein l23a-like n=1 Tax=Lynx pardinus TaxID=191816 RepID=A0A485PSY4_LYNPA|nr:60s ribosomal protein l23a-like [Lynx pardinus]